MSVEHRLVEEEVSELPPDVIEGAFRSICAAMLLRTITEFSTDSTGVRERINRRVAAREWLFRGGGIISFREACDACNISTQVFKDAVVEYADNPESRPNNKYRNNCGRKVFGRPNRDYHRFSNQSPSESRDHSGVVPCDRTRHRAR